MSPLYSFHLQVDSFDDSELNAARGNPHLYRAVIRSLHRPLSVLATNLSSLLLPLLAAPGFLNPPAPTPATPLPNAVQNHALGIAKFAEELLIAFDQLELGTDNDARGDGLKSVREGLVSVIQKVTTPLVTGIRNELLPLIEALERPAPQVTPAKGTTATKSAANAIVYHPSIVTLQTLIPLYARALARYTSSATAQATLANLLVTALWKSMVALAHRADIAPSPPPSPTVGPSGFAKKRRGSPSTTPPATPPPSRFMLKLPPSRPASPTPPPVVATAAGDCKALLELLNQLPRPAPEGSSQLAREAVDEAFKGLQALAVFLETLQAIHISLKTPQEQADELQTLTEELPTLIALPPLLRMYAAGSLPPVSEITGLSEEDYRRSCLSGFGRAEEVASVVGQRVQQRLHDNPNANQVLCKWLDLEMDLT